MIYFVKFQAKDNESLIFVCWSIVGGSIITIYQFISLYAMGKRYFELMSFDILVMLTYWVFIVLYFTLPYENDADTYLRCLCIILILTKFVSMLRIYNCFGNLVNFYETSARDLLPMIFSLVLFVLGFFMLYTQSGIKSPEQAYYGGAPFYQDFSYIW